MDKAMICDSKKSFDDEPCFEVAIPLRPVKILSDSLPPEEAKMPSHLGDMANERKSETKTENRGSRPIQSMMVFTKEVSKPISVGHPKADSRNSTFAPEKTVIKDGVSSKSSEAISLARLQEIMVLLKKTSSTVDSPMLSASPQSDTPQSQKQRDRLSIFSPIQTSQENPNAPSPLRVENEGFTVGFIQKNTKPEFSIFAFDGAVDTTQQKAIDEFFDRCIAEGVFHIVCDLTGVVFINSSGWGAFVSHLQRMRKLGGNVFLCGMQSSIDDSFRLLELDKLFSTHRSIDDCKKSIEEDYVRGTAANSLPMPQGSVSRDIPLSFDDKIARVIAENPDYDNRQFLKRLQSQDYGETKIGMHDLTVKLRSMDLLTKEKRYRFFRSL